MPIASGGSPLKAMRKGQTEIMGLLIIVILLLVIGVIYLRFRLADGGENYGDVRTSTEASNLLKAAMNLNVGSLDLQELIVACSQEAHQCTLLQRELEQVFRYSLQSGTDFRYVLMANDRELLRFGGCSFGIVGTFISVKEGVVFESRLTLCDE